MPEAFHAVALAHGGQDNRAPGERKYRPGTAPCPSRNPQGNGIEWCELEVRYPVDSRSHTAGLLL